MRKKSVAGKIVEKSKKKEIKKKPKAAIKPLKKTVREKKEVKKTKSRTKMKKVVTKKVKAKIEKKPKKVSVKVKEKPKKIAKKIIARAGKKPRKIRVRIEEKPQKVVAYRPVPLGALPEEYYENIITLMIVDPVKLFTFWEVRKDTLSMYTGELNIRVYDITGVDFDGMNANTYFDIPVNNRIGSRYIDMTPEKEFVADIGIVSPYDIFITITRSNKISTPRARISEEGLLPAKLYETGLRIGY